MKERTHLLSAPQERTPTPEFYYLLECMDLERLLERLREARETLTPMQRYELAGWLTENAPAYEYFTFKDQLKYIGNALKLSVPQKGFIHSGLDDLNNYFPKK